MPVPAVGIHQPAIGSMVFKPNGMARFMGYGLNTTSQIGANDNIGRDHSAIGPDPLGSGNSAGPRTGVTNRQDNSFRRIEINEGEGQTPLPERILRPRDSVGIDQNRRLPADNNTVIESGIMLVKVTKITGG